MQLENTTDVFHILLFCECEALNHQIGSAFQENNAIVEYHCLESLPDDIDRNFPADVAILDIGFQIQKSFPILKNIKSRRPDIPVIVLAEEGSEEQVIAAFRLGARDYFKKPLNMLLLVETAKSLIHMKRASRERRHPVKAEMYQPWTTSALARTNLPRAILKSLLVMNHRLTEKISVDELAKAAGMSKHHFCRTFKNSTGLTAMQMLSSLRIERAKRLLESTDFAISEVAVETGFNDIGSFTRHFKKATRGTASGYRNSLKPKK